MARFRLAAPLSVPLKLFTVTTTTTTLGVETKTFDKTGELIFGNFRSFGGTERDVDGLYVVEKTATIETWYRSDIKSNCRIQVIATGEMYEVMGEPENIEMRNQYLRIKVKQVKGGA